MLENDLIQSTSSWPFVEIRKLLKDRKELGKIIGTSNNNIKQKEVGLMGVFQGFSQEQLEGASRDQKQIEGESK